jgi:alkylhydroperoxidase family enzyme
MSEKWWSIFLRPVFILGMRQKRVGAVEDSGAGPWGVLIAALNGTAAPPVLRRMVVEFNTASGLPLRTKLLMLAVIGRALGCPFCERQTLDLAAAEGLSPEAADEALDTMQSPEITPLEATLLPFARATVRYEPYRIQERTARLLSEIGTEKTLEAVVVTAMGNMLVRLAMLLAP